MNWFMWWLVVIFVLDAAEKVLRAAGARVPDRGPGYHALNAVISALCAVGILIYA